ncbi:PaaR repeat-containing protein [Hyphomicrobium denitrificans ATCC 51888]|uniref:PaaR repeat-containing protein n=1 Tax=Hyphomicrobium denitrificans (strain ATCC 51888 / DSM 1869 / NCIMB 11706 / TK 0415) TaxID=582899 RepID=D8JWD3_HYPDA|nr:PAAR domain-containing protein [Hyphomicrobium denitrificans]ADJ23046.1 PaaR repeat-containing protein [Hyphomicrobium denitrificans ATCC 51888]
MPLICRLGDTSTHGGAIITSASISKCEGALIARQGDILDCPIHGPNPIVGHSSKMRCEGPYVARHGDLTECGASLISGATKSLDE